MIMQEEEEEEAPAMEEKQEEAEAEEQQQQQLPTTCFKFWVGGVGFTIKTAHLERFLGGNHFLARLAHHAADGMLLESTPLAAYVDVDAIAARHPNTRHVHLDEHCGSFFANALFMPTILDFITRRAKDDPTAPMYRYALPNKSDDAVALDMLQDFLFCGKCFALRS